MAKDNKLTATITRGSEQYAAWIEEVPGIYAAGDTVKEVKEDLLDALELYKKENHDKFIPDVIQGTYELVWNFDTPSFLEYYSSIFSKSGLERLTGINQKQLGHYASGLKKPRKPQVEKIEKAIRWLADDLSQIHLV